MKELQEDFSPQKLRSELLEALVSLSRRSLIEKIATKFTQQPVVMEYVKERFIDLFYEKIGLEKDGLLRRHTLIKVTAKDYIQENQLRLILERILSWLQNNTSQFMRVEIASTQTKPTVAGLKTSDSR